MAPCGLGGDPEAIQRFRRNDVFREEFLDHAGLVSVSRKDTLQVLNEMIPSLLNGDVLWHNFPTLNRLLLLSYPHFAEKHSLPPLWEFSLERISALPEWCHSNLDTPQSIAQLESFLLEASDAAWTRMAQLLTCRARIQLVSWNVPPNLESPEDLAQSTVVEAREAHNDFRGSTEGEYVKWLKTILHNLAVNRLRRLKRADGAELRQVSADELCERWSTHDGFRIADTNQLTGSHILRKQEMVDLLYTAIERLPEKNRVVLIAKIAEQTFERISTDSGIPKTTVVRLYHEALKLVGKSIEDMT